MATMGSGFNLEIDFRNFVNSMRMKEKVALKSVQDYDTKRQIFMTIAEDALMSKGTDTGATDAAIEAVTKGEYIQKTPFVNDKGILRYAQAHLEINSAYTDGIYINPVDAKDRPYGLYSVIGADGTSTGSDLIGYKLNPKTYDTIYDIVLDHLKKEGL